MQLFAEVGKWLQKEDIQPAKADKRIFKMAPLIVLVSTFLLVAVVPFGPDAYFTNFDAGVFYMLAVSSISTLGILIAGWSSANKYSLLGGLRAAGQLIACGRPLMSTSTTGTASTSGFKPVLWTPGDWNAFFGFGTNILVNMLVLTGLLRFVLKMPDSLVFGRILPALGLMMCLSTFYYAYLAYKLAQKTGRSDVCALPSGSVRTAMNAA